VTPAEKAGALCGTSPDYTMFSVRYGCVEKVFNHKRGSLKLYRFGQGNRVTVNIPFETKRDRARLLKLYPGTVVVEDDLGYPGWYFRGLKDPDKEDKP